jgi:hypothetical protein
VPLHGYRHVGDLRTANEYWNLDNKLADNQFIYCGPGLWRDPQTGRIHARLAYTTLSALDLFSLHGASPTAPWRAGSLPQNYRGETDPRNLALSIGGPEPALRIEGARHLRIEDVVLRGSSAATVELVGCRDVALDGVTVYGGAPAVRLEGCQRLTFDQCAVRGLAAPWSSRSSMKYRGASAYLVWAEAAPPTEDVEISFSEFTDSHDGPYLGTVRRLRFHHNLVDHHNDDGLYLVSRGVGGDSDVYQNHFSRCLDVFPFHGTDPIGAGVRIYRNTIDMRPAVAYGWPAAVNDPAYVPQGPGGRLAGWPGGWLCGDHGSPTWEPVWFYHNTVLADSGEYPRGVYAHGWGGHMARTSRHVFNNVFVQIDGNPGLEFTATAGDDLQADGNLHWGLVAGPEFAGDYFAAWRASLLFEASRREYAPGWGAHDVFGDPRLAAVPLDWRAAIDLRLQEGSAAVDAGVRLPDDWPDPLRPLDTGAPDIGALPLRAETPTVGIEAR